jgi:hypothetical protein
MLEAVGAPPAPARYASSISDGEFWFPALQSNELGFG